MNILIIDGNKEQCNFIYKNLTDNGHKAKRLYDGQTAVSEASEGEYDIIILETEVGHMSGIKLLKKMRAKGCTAPVIFTADNDNGDKIKCLELGDDYLERPFGMDELRARIAAITRRRKGSAEAVIYADITLKTESRRLSGKDGEVELSAEECEAMKYMITNSSVVVPFKRIAQICSCPEQGIKKIIDNIKEKLMTICSKVQIIYIRDVGYKLCSDM